MPTARLLQRHFTRLLSALFLLVALLPAAPAPADELDLGASLEGFPFDSPYSVILAPDGQDVYATGNSGGGQTSAAAGLVWLHRDPDTGKLVFGRNYLSDRERPMVFGAEISQYGNYLYVLLQDRVETFLRRFDGSLTPWSSRALPGNIRPQAIRRLAFGGVLVDGLDGGAILQDNGDGFLNLTAALDNNTGRTGRELLALSDHLFISGPTVLHRQGAEWSTRPLTDLTTAATNFPGLHSPDLRYFYAYRFEPANFPSVHFLVVTFELQGGLLVEVATSEIPNNFEVEHTAAAIHPQSGDLYLASYNTNGGDQGRIEHYRAAEGGRRFTTAETLNDPSREISARTAKHSLTFTPDGSQLYASFGGEPMALLAVDPATGALTWQPGAAGPHGLLVRPSKMVSLVPGEAYVLTSGAVLTTRWDAGGPPAITSSLGLEGWTAALRRQVRDLVLTPGGGAGVLAGPNDVVMLERDRATGELRLLPATSQRSGSSIRQLAISPDGRYIYVLGSGLVVYYLRRDSQPGLVLARAYTAQELGGAAGEIRLAANGVDVLLLSSGRPLLFRRSIETGELDLSSLREPRPDLTDVGSAQFTQDGQLLYLFRTFGPANNAPGRIEAIARRPNGDWDTVAQKDIYAYRNGWQLASARGDEVYQLSAEGLFLYGLVNRSLAFTLPVQEYLSQADLVSVGGRLSEDSNSFDEGVEPLALFAGGGDLLIASPGTGNLRRVRRGCGRLEAGPCMDYGRFRIDVEWRDAAGLGLPAEISPFGSNSAQIFSFFEGGNWEMMVKVLDGCALNQRFWVYAASSTDVGFTIRVKDVLTGDSRSYRSEAGSPAPAITDAGAFATCDAFPGPGGHFPHSRPPLAENPVLTLENRFQLRVSWTDHQGHQGQATSLKETGALSQSGLFYFFDRENWEMQVKVLDGCAINGHHWVLGAATTDVGYQLQVFDPVSGRTNTYGNTAGHASPAILDLEAFPCR